MVWPDLDARRIDAVTPSVGYVPERIKNDRADVFRLTLEPGQTVTFVAELASDRFARLFLWKAIEYEQRNQGRQLFNGIMLGITGLLAIFLTAVFAANHKAIFPTAAIFTWCVLAYLCVDFGFWHKLFNVRPEENAQYRAATEAGMAATLLIFLYTFLRLGAWHGFVRMLLVLWVAAQLVLVAVAFLDPRLAATFARLSSVLIASVGAALTLFLAMRGQDRALSLVPTWMLLLVWLFGAGITFTGRLSGDIVVFGLTAGLVLIVVLIGFTVTQYAFRSVEPLYGVQPGEQQLRSLAVDGAGAGVWEWNERRDEIKVSPVVEAILGLKAGELSAKIDDFTKHMHPTDRERFKLLLASVKERADGELRIEFRMRHVDNSYRWFELEAAAVPSADRRNVRCVGLIREVTDAKRAQERLMHDAVHDSLSGLPNRELFLDRLAIIAKRATLEPLVRPALLFIDIDKFKSVNASFGLIVGDSLLLTVARRLGRNLGPQDTLARVGGDQFALLLLSQSNPSELAMLAEQVRRSLRAPINIAGQEIVLTASIGIALYDGPDEDPAELLREAEIAMYRAKRAGPDRIEIFNAAMRTEKDSRPALESELRRAIEKKQLKLVYQPIFYLPTETLAGFEALVRWEHPHARAPQPRRVRARGRGDGPHRQARVLRSGPRRARGGALAEGAAAAGRAGVRGRQRLEPAAVQAGAGQGGAPHPRPRRDPQGLAAARDHRIARHGEPGEGDGGAARAVRGGRRPGARRFRHRLLVALLPQPVHLRHHQDRPLVPAGERRERHRIGDLALDRGPGPRARQERGRRGHRDRGRRRPAAHDRLRIRARLLLRRAHDRAGGAAAPEGRAPQRAAHEAAQPRCASAREAARRRTETAPPPRRRSPQRPRPRSQAAPQHARAENGARRGQGLPPARPRMRRRPGRGCPAEAPLPQARTRGRPQDRRAHGVATGGGTARRHRPPTAPPRQRRGRPCGPRGQDAIAPARIGVPADGAHPAGGPPPQPTAATKPAAAPCRRCRRHPCGQVPAPSPRPRRHRSPHLNPKPTARAKAVGRRSGPAQPRTGPPPLPPRSAAPARRTGPPPLPGSQARSEPLQPRPAQANGRPPPDFSKLPPAIAQSLAKLAGQTGGPASGQAPRRRPRPAGADADGKPPAG